MTVFACIIPDSAVLTLREEMPSSDSCGNPFLEKQIEGLLAVGCGAVFNISWEKEKIPQGSGDDDYDNIDYLWPVTTVETTVPSSRTPLSTASHHRTAQSTKAVGVGIISITPKRSASRLPPRFTPNPETRHSSFQHLVRIHLNTFNQRLSMMESNTLDMKESIRRIEEQQSILGSRLKELVSTQSNTEKNKRVGELEKSYNDMEARLTRLEGRLEILIDGFTELARQLNRLKRNRRTFRLPKKKRVLPSFATVLPVPSYSTPQPPVRIIPTEPALLRKATVPKSIPTPSLPMNKTTIVPKRGRKLNPTVNTNTTKLQSVTRLLGSQVSTRAATKLKTTLNKPRTVSKANPKTTVRPETKRPEGRMSTVTDKHVIQPNQTRPKKVKEETTMTKFQLEPPSHKSKPAKTPQMHKQSDQANKKESVLPIKNTGHNKTFSLDAPVIMKGGEGGKCLQGDSKKSSKPHKVGFNQNEKKNSAKDKITTTTTKASTAKKSKTTIKGTKTPAKTKAATTAKKKSKKTQKKKKTNPHSAVLDLLRLLKGDLSANKKKNQDGSLHVVLGRLAIPVKIIPDD